MTETNVPDVCENDVRLAHHGNLSPSKSLTLAELQDLFQRAVMDGDDAILAGIPGNGRTTSDVLLGVYRYAYRARLTEILAADHPHLKRLMGADAFKALADVYITAHPSDTPNVRWFSRKLPNFLKETEPFSKRKELAEIAELEHSLALAFDAADQTHLTLEALQSIAPEAWADLQFESHPSVARLNFNTNAYASWLALENDRDPPATIALDRPQRLLVWRKGLSARVRDLTDEEAMMWDEAMRGVAFGRLCELLATFDDPETAPMRAAQYLQSWIAAGLLVAHASNS